MPDPDLEMGGPVSKKNSSTLRASAVWSENKGGGGAGPPAPPLDPPLFYGLPKYQIGKLQPISFPGFSRTVRENPGNEVELQRVQNTAAYEHAFPTRISVKLSHWPAGALREMSRHIFLDLLLRSFKYILFSFY